MARRCGLDDPEEYAAKQRGKYGRRDMPPHMRDPSRKTGRTTERLLMALVALEHGHDVTLVAHEMRHADHMKMDLRLMGATAGVPTDGRIRTCTHGTERLSGTHVVIRDHALS